MWAFLPFPFLPHHFRPLCAAAAAVAETDTEHEAHQRGGSSGVETRRFVYLTERALPEQQQQQQDKTESRSDGETRSTRQEGAFDDIVSFLSMHPR